MVTKKFCPIFLLVLKQVLTRGLSLSQEMSLTGRKRSIVPFRPAEFPTLKLGLCGIEFSNVNTLLYLFLYFFVSAKLAKWLLRRLFFEFLYYYEYLFKWQDNHYLDNFKLLLFHLNDMIVYLHSIIAVILFCFTLFIFASN